MQFFYNFSDALFAFMQRGGDAKAMAGGVSRSTIPAMAGLAVALTGTLANQFLVNRAQKEKDLLVDRLVAE